VNALRKFINISFSVADFKPERLQPCNNLRFAVLQILLVLVDQNKVVRVSYICFYVQLLFDKMVEVVQDRKLDELRYL
jgi:hypothetical protein